MIEISSSPASPSIQIHSEYSDGVDAAWRVVAQVMIGPSMFLHGPALYGQIHEVMADLAGRLGDRKVSFSPPGGGGEWIAYDGTGTIPQGSRVRCETPLGIVATAIPGESKVSIMFPAQVSDKVWVFAKYLTGAANVPEQIKTGGGHLVISRDRHHTYSVVVNGQEVRVAVWEKDPVYRPYLQTRQETESHDVTVAAACDVLAAAWDRLGQKGDEYRAQNKRR